ncbi:MAG: repressor LexA [Pyrinomonadaceae bacterium]|jgi:repressor LexA|nr:repressor LexA [Pyrinomonadaceae bacterium]
MPKHQLSPNETQALRFIRNSLIHSKSPSIRDIQKDLGYSSPRSAALIVEKLIKAGRIERKNDGRLRLLKELSETNSYARTILVPLVGTAACGMPLLAEENVETMIPVSTELAKPGHRYFLLRAKGDSMDQAGISDGDLVLVRQQSTADSGKVVVALIDDEATIKEFHRSQNTVVLKPRSNSSRHRPIILTKEFQIQGLVLTTISGLD